MIHIKDFATKHNYPMRALRYFISEKLTADSDYFVIKNRLMLPTETQLLIHERFHYRRKYPISYRRIKNELGFHIKDIKLWTLEGIDYILVGHLYHFSLDAFKKLIDRKEGMHNLRSEYTSPKGVTVSRDFSEMTKREKEHWANEVRLSNEAKELIFKK